MRILLDLDEVICDFIGGACKAFNANKGDVLGNWQIGQWNMIPPLALARGFKISDEFFWAVIHQKGEHFWEELEPLPWAGEVINLIMNITDDWHIVSAPSRCPSSYTGKVKWLKNFLGKDFDRFALTPHKSIFAQKDVLLIDDKEQNVVDFMAAGGDGLVFPRHHNNLHMLRNDPVGHLRRILQPFTSGADRAYQNSERQHSLSDACKGNSYGYDPDQAV